MNKADVQERVLGILAQLGEDWEYEDEITPQTWLVRDLALQSLDVVVLGTTIQNHYEQSLPFAEFLVEVGKREVRDIRVDELVEFVHRSLVVGEGGES